MPNRIKSRPGDETFYQPYTGNTWVCVDERKTDFLHLQVGGGPVGIASARGAASERQKKGGFLDLGRTVTEFAGVIVHIIDGNLALLRHAKCGREARAPHIIGRIATDAGKVFALANFINNDLTANEFDIFTDIYDAMMQSNTVETDSQADQLLEHGGKIVDSNAPGGFIHVGAVATVPILDHPHRSATFKYNHGLSAFDSDTAWDAGNPSYNLSYGSLRPLNAHLNEFLGPVNEKHFLSAISIETAATALELQELTGVTFTHELLEV
jgi:hypothetical protein